MIEVKICDAPTCTRRARSSHASWCDMHRQRMQSHGRLDVPERLRPIESRFWAKVDRRAEDECWPWLAAVDPQTGYGRIGVGRRSGGVTSAHRVSYEINVGPIPRG